jgi:uncharacterized protein (TIGR00369 family)
VQEPATAARLTTLTVAQVMLPEDANPHGNVHGGTLMKLADTAGGTCAARYCRRLTVTAVMDSMTFEQPVYVGDLVAVDAVVTWTGRTSLEVLVTIHAENVLTGTIRRVSTSFFVFVAIDEHGHPCPVPPLQPGTDEERQRWAEAEQRRTLRLQRRQAA